MVVIHTPRQPARATRDSTSALNYIRIQVQFKHRILSVCSRLSFFPARIAAAQIQGKKIVRKELRPEPTLLYPFYHSRRAAIFRVLSVHMPAPQLVGEGINLLREGSERFGGECDAWRSDICASQDGVVTNLQKWIQSFLKLALRCKPQQEKLLEKFHACLLKD